MAFDSSLGLQLQPFKAICRVSNPSGSPWFISSKSSPLSPWRGKTFQAPGRFPVGHPGRLLAPFGAHMDPLATPFLTGHVSSLVTVAPSNYPDPLPTVKSCYQDSMLRCDPNLSTCPSLTKRQAAPDMGVGPRNRHCFGFVSFRDSCHLPHKYTTIGVRLRRVITCL